MEGRTGQFSMLSNWQRDFHTMEHVRRRVRPELLGGPTEDSAHAQAYAEEFLETVRSTFAEV
ncbi:hypothetical protein HPP92_028481 [Vanilla planifolia]|uniref:Uncharacterized protein n=1 Tax=Vanilla planifolia TaxID=51239 RepID=A0A835U477_VANPL|nr:hypothetical protein HPP92_028481 [Vanilla planifolia]